MVKEKNMMEFGVSNPLIEVIFGIVSFVGSLMLVWATLMVEPPKTVMTIPADLNVWERHRLRKAQKKEGHRS